jgi:hypothetical protein
VSTTRDRRRELASRETDGIVVSLLWCALGHEVEVVVADTRQGTEFSFAVAPDRALDAFHHPFLYAGSDVAVEAPQRTQDVAA